MRLALEEIYPRTRTQRCWLHKTGNVLNALPKSAQPKAKRALHDIWQAATLLIGVYGRDAANYADGRRTEQEQIGDSDAARTWTLIASEIEHLMHTAPAAHLH